MFNPNDNLPPNHGPNQPRRPGGLALIFFAAVLGIFLLYSFRGDSSPVMNITYSEFLRFVDQNQIESVTINKNDTIDVFLKGSSANGSAQYRTNIPYDDPNLLSNLRERNINVSGAPVKVTLMRVLMDMLP